MSITNPYYRDSRIGVTEDWKTLMGRWAVPASPWKGHKLPTTPGHRQSQVRGAGADAGDILGPQAQRAEFISDQ